MDGVDLAIQATMAPAASGAIAGAVSDGTLGDMDFDDVRALAATAAGPFRPDVEDAVLSQFWGDAVAKHMMAGMNRSEGREEEVSDARRSSMFGKLSESESGSLARAVAAGDGSALLRLKENYYFS